MLLPCSESEPHLEDLSQKLEICLDDVQKAVDRAGLCDQSHLIARRKGNA